MARIYTKKPGCPPDFEDPVILRSGANVKHVCHTIHRTLPDVFKYALVWVRFLPDHFVNGDSNSNFISGDKYQVFSSKGWTRSYR